MQSVTEKEMQLVLRIFKTPETQYNANSIARELHMSAMGALKIAKRLEKEHILLSQKLGKATFYKIHIANEYTQQYIKFLLQREAAQAHPYVKRWITELKKIHNSDVVILFGSVLRKHKQAKDVDVLLVTDQKRFQKLKKEIVDINAINLKKIHPMYQTKKDIVKNIQKRDKPILNALKGIVVSGEDTLMRLLTQ